MHFRLAMRQRPHDIVRVIRVVQSDCRKQVLQADCDRRQGDLLAVASERHHHVSRWLRDCAQYPLVVGAAGRGLRDEVIDRRGRPSGDNRFVPFVDIERRGRRHFGRGNVCDPDHGAEEAIQQ